MLPKWAWHVCIVTKYMYSVNFGLLSFFNIFVCSCRSRTCLNAHTLTRLTRETARDYQTEGCQATSQNDRLPDGQTDRKR